MALHLDLSWTIATNGTNSELEELRIYYPPKLRESKIDMWVIVNHTYSSHPSL